jgi:hypothetical protein
VAVFNAERIFDEEKLLYCSWALVGGKPCICPPSPKGFFERKIEKLKKLFSICTQRYDVWHSGTFAKLRGVSVKISLYAKFLVPPPPNSRALFLP